MRKPILCALSFVLLSGCAAPKKQAIDSAALQSLNDQSLAVTTRAVPTFSVLTTGNALFGVVGGLAGNAEGNRIIAENHVPDPALEISAGLSKALEASRGVRVVAQPVSVDAEDAGQVADQAKSRARFVVDVQTFNWMLLYFPTDWTHYRVVYRAKARLIDTATKAVLAEGACEQVPEDSKTAPTYDAMLANGASLLKATLARYASACIGILNREMLSLGDTGVQAGSVLAGAQPPSASTARLAASTGAAAATENWNGYMACGARRDQGRNSGPYQARFAMEVNGASVTVHRKTADVVENLSGQVSDSQLVLSGNGHWIDEPSRRWEFVMRGALQPGAASYVATGSMQANGQAIRTCELRMTRA